MTRRRGRMLLVGLLAGPTGASALAHDPGLSTAEVRVLAGRVSARLTFSARDLEALVLERTGGPAPAGRLQELAREAFEVSIDGRRAVQVVAESALEPPAS